MGRPGYGERDCPRRKFGSSCGWNSFERLYARRGSKRIPVGRRCSKCGYAEFDDGKNPPLTE